MIRRLDYQGDLGDQDALADALAVSGLSAAACRAKARLVAQAAAALPAGARPAAALFVPGRIEVLGKHTDYAGGNSIVAAAERGFALVASPRNDNRVAAIDAAGGRSVAFPLEAGLVPRSGHWSNYPMTVARRVARNFPGAATGMDAAFASDLPPAAGMSSSSAMMVAFFLALDAVGSLSSRPEFQSNISGLTDLAGYLGTAENGQTFGSLAGDLGVGTFGGSEDHTAILCAESGHVSQYAYCPVRPIRSIPVPSGWLFALASSGVAAEKTGAAMQRYNAASKAAAAVTALWCRETGRDDPHLAAALASGPDAGERLASIVQTAAPPIERDRLAARLEQFVVENGEILPAAGDALAVADMEAFGRLVDRSEHAAETLLGNQVPETIHLAASARALGAAAASAFGAGFGGSVWALVEATAAEEFLAAWAKAYRERFPQHAGASAFLLTSAGPAAFRIC